MFIIPAIDLKDGLCVRLEKGEFNTVKKVSDDVIETAKSFEAAGAEWLHMVDLDGALRGEGRNYQKIGDVIAATSLNVQIGGGLRNMRTLDMLNELGAKRMIIGSAAVDNPDFVSQAIRKYEDKIVVGVDMLFGEVKTSGWTKSSGVSGLEFAKNMEKIGVKMFIFTDIERDGMLSGPPLAMLERLKESLNAKIIASGGISSISDLRQIYELDLYGAIVGKALYSEAFELRTAITIFDDRKLDRFFVKSDLIPVVVQHAETNEVLMLGYTNIFALRKSIETKTAWFYSRSRDKLWNKGETSGNYLNIKEITADCDNDTLLFKCIPEGPVCHTGKISCFYRKV